MLQVGVLFWQKKEAGTLMEGHKNFDTGATGFSFGVVLKVLNELRYVGGEWEFTFSAPNGRMLTVDEIKRHAAA
jgi:hypothetical protein